MELDVSLLHGFSFECRPGCGLCCFANPAVAPDEAPPLLQIRPALTLLEGEDGYRFLDNRPGGGACDLLRDLRCSAHPIRPFPCRSFPISVHLGLRAQASVVLTCPGLDLSGLDHPREPQRGPPRGLEAELAAVRTELDRPASERIFHAAAERMRTIQEDLAALSGWSDPASLRAELRSADFAPDLSGFPEPAPSEDVGIDSLPVTFDPVLGRIALTGEGEQWTVLRLSESGGGPSPMGTYVLGRHAPELDGDARRLLQGYLQYAFDRDAVVGQIMVQEGQERDPDMTAGFRAAVAEATGMVLTRASILSAARGDPAERLGRAALLRGIQASDADLLDRPTAGAVL